MHNGLKMSNKKKFALKYFSLMLFQVNYPSRSSKLCKKGDFCSTEIDINYQDFELQYTQNLAFSQVIKGYLAPNITGPSLR